MLYMAEEDCETDWGREHMMEMFIHSFLKQGFITSLLCVSPFYIKFQDHLSE